MTQRTWLGAVLLGAAVAAAVAADAPAGAAPGAIDTRLQGVAHDALFGVAFDGAHGIAVGAPGRVLDSTDGGKTWKVDAGFPSSLAALGVDLRAGRALAVGQMGEIFVRGADRKWLKADSGTRERLMSVSVNATGLAVAGGAFGTVVKSTDAGATWQPLVMDWAPYLSEDQQAQGIQPHLFAVHVSDAGVITLAGEFALILRSADAGATWTAVNRGDAAIFALDLRADGVGYAVGQDGLVLRSADGGASWTAATSGTRANLLGVRSSGARVVISAMHDMLSSGDGGASFTRVLSPDVQAGWYSGVGVGDDGFIAVGHAGRIIKVNI